MEHPGAGSGIPALIPAGNMEPTASGEYLGCRPLLWGNAARKSSGESRYLDKRRILVLHTQNSASRAHPAPLLHPAGVRAPQNPSFRPKPREKGNFSSRSRARVGFQGPLHLPGLSLDPQRFPAAGEEEEDELFRLSAAP